MIGTEVMDIGTEVMVIGTVVMVIGTEVMVIGTVVMVIGTVVMVIGAELGTRQHCRDHETTMCSGQNIVAFAVLLYIRCDFTLFRHRALYFFRMFSCDSTSSI